MIIEVVYFGHVFVFLINYKTNSGVGEKRKGKEGKCEYWCQFGEGTRRMVYLGGVKGEREDPGTGI